MKTSIKKSVIKSVSVFVSTAVLSLAAIAEPANKQQLSFNKAETSRSAVVNGVQPTTGFGKYVFNRVERKSIPAVGGRVVASHKSSLRADRNI